MSALETIQLRVHGDAALPTLIYLPGLHGDWTLVSSFRATVAGRVRFVEFTYPCRTDWTLEDYARGVVEQLAAHGITSGWMLAESFGSQVAWKILELVASGVSPDVEPRRPARRNEREQVCDAEELRGSDRAAGRQPSTSGRMPDTTGQEHFQPLGLILAGGFVRHPVTLGVHGFHFAQRRIPWPCFQLLLKFYARYARLRHRQAPETLAAIDEFVRRRTRADNLAIASRYPLIARADFRDTARRTTLPVFALAGFFDPIVLWPFVHPWLRRNCPGFRARRIILNADHNVLATTPKISAEQVLRWMDGC